MKTRYITIIILLLATIFNSCDKVSPPYIEARDYCGGNKKVLIEDYTGHGCVNCPGAAVLAHELKEQFCERVVIIAVHAGYFAAPDFENNPLFAADFTTEAGNTWDSYFGNSNMGNPNGLIDRVQGSTGYVIYPQSWATTADTLLMEPAKAILTISNDFDNDSKSLSTTIKTEFQENVTGTYKLIVCITQDNIVAPQKNNNAEIGPTPIFENYVHNHVLRKVINGAWGENISASGSVEMSSTYEKSYTQVFDSSWVPADCHVVAFVYNEETKRVLQVEELGVME
ncbi:MAG: Omp28 family outer membrane lipoprotein [Bacteroidetes bacterium]|nr:Omp28 family outer membrane lipoprotein [Bacteroidota bacterium]MBL6944919.1 Omp28 family outer membrane lipoprotein [Bacteroidales bacterium]